MHVIMEWDSEPQLSIGSNAFIAAIQTYSGTLTWEFWILIAVQWNATVESCGTVVKLILVIL
jgi:hypothetical protein